MEKFKIIGLQEFGSQIFFNIKTRSEPPLAIAVESSVFALDHIPMRPEDLNNPKGFNVFMDFVFRKSIEKFNKLKHFFSTVGETCKMAKLTNFEKFIGLIDTLPVANLLCRLAVHLNNLADQVDDVANTLNEEQIIALEFLVLWRRSKELALKSILMDKYLYFDKSVGCISRFELE